MILVSQTRGGFTFMALQKERLRLAHFGKRYSTRELHEPDRIVFARAGV